MAIPSPNILVVEDDRETRTLIAKYLRNNACNVTAVSDGREMSRAMADHRVDLIILDVMLPGEDGLSLCRKVRSEAQTPIIMLTARGEDVDRIVGLEMGADDYLAKPFNPRELLARINAVLRRQASAQAASSIEGAPTLAFEGWRIDLRLRELRNPEGARVAVTSAEFDLLRTFCERPGRVLSRDSLLDLTQGATPVRSSAPSTCWSAASAARSSPIRRIRPSSRRCAPAAICSRPERKRSRRP
jgi:two-component system OmpR family response regulator